MKITSLIQYPYSGYQEGVATVDLLTRSEGAVLNIMPVLSLKRPGMRFFAHTQNVVEFKHKENNLNENILITE